METKLKDNKNTETKNTETKNGAMAETTRKWLGDYISQLLSKTEWCKTQTSTNAQGSATTVARPSAGGLTVPSTGTGARAAIEIPSKDRQQANISAQCYTTAIAKAPATGFEMNRRFSGIIDNATQELPFNNLLGVSVPKDHSEAIEKMKSAIKQIQEPIYEDRIKDFVKGNQFKTWLTSKSSDALLVNNKSMNLSPVAKGVSLLTEFTLLLHEKLSLLLKDKKASTLLYLCADFPESTETMTTMQRMLRYLTSERYVNDRNHWDKLESVRQYIDILKAILEKIPTNKQQEIEFLIDSFIHMLEETQKGKVIYILIDGLDLVERDESKVDKDFEKLLDDLYGLIEDLNKLIEGSKPCPVIKLLMTYHTSCDDSTRKIWNGFVQDMPLPLKEASKTRRTA